MPESKSTSPGSEMTIRLWRTFTASPSFVSVSSLAFSFSNRALMSSSWWARSLYYSSAFSRSARSAFIELTLTPRASSSFVRSSTFFWASASLRVVGVLVGLELVVLGELRLPLVFRVPAAAGGERKSDAGPERSVSESGHGGGEYDDRLPGPSLLCGTRIPTSAPVVCRQRPSTPCSLRDRVTASASRACATAFGWLMTGL